MKVMQEIEERAGVKCCFDPNGGEVQRHIPKKAHIWCKSNDSTKMVHSFQEARWTNIYVYIIMFK